MAGIVNTQTCACCRRELPLDMLWLDDKWDASNPQWLCNDPSTCVDVVHNKTMAHNAIVILNGLLDSIDNWLFASRNEPYPAWDNTLADLVMVKQYADPSALTDLITKMEAKGMELSAAMLKDPD